jgi:hypothetical protein
LRSLTVPEPIGLQMICSCLRLACNFSIADSNGTNPSIGRGQRDFNCTRCRLLIQVDRFR